MPDCIKTEELVRLCLCQRLAGRRCTEGGRPGACGGYKLAFEKAGAGAPFSKSNMASMDSGDHAMMILPVSY
jgi:hypothetical protein